MADTPLPGDVRATLQDFAGRVVFIRRPRGGGRGGDDDDGGITVVEATTAETGGDARALVLPSLDALPGSDLRSGAALQTPLVLVCVHGRRDACCARLGTPLYAEIAATAWHEHVWQCSHLGGHRFAPNVLVLPSGVQLGRVPAARVPDVVSLLAAGRIPLELYRGRTLYPPHVQAAEVALRAATGLDGVGELRLLADGGDRVEFVSPGGQHAVRVSRRDGPPAPPSCGAGAEPTTMWTATLEPDASP